MNEEHIKTLQAMRIPTDNGSPDIFRIQSAVSNALEAGLINQAEAELVNDACESGIWTDQIAAIISRADTAPYQLSELQRVLAEGLGNGRITEAEKQDAIDLYTTVYELKTSGEDSISAHKLIQLINKATV